MAVPPRKFAALDFELALVDQIKHQIHVWTRAACAVLEAAVLASSPLSVAGSWPYQPRRWPTAWWLEQARSTR